MALKVDKMLGARREALARLEAELSELRLAYNGVPYVEAEKRAAMLRFIKVRESRVKAVRAEVLVLETMAQVGDPRQLEVPGAPPVKKK